MAKKKKEMARARSCLVPDFKGKPFSLSPLSTFISFGIFSE
jgi:hypothetical protein